MLQILFFLVSQVVAADTIVIVPGDPFFFYNRQAIIQPLDRNFFDGPRSPEVTVDRKGKARYYSDPRNIDDPIKKKPEAAPSQKSEN